MPSDMFFRCVAGIVLARSFEHKSGGQRLSVGNNTLSNGEANKISQRMEAELQHNV
jgi:hypothetical protein